MHQGVLETVRKATIGSLFAAGFPAWPGGTLQFTYGMGVDHFIAGCQELTAKFGTGFEFTDAVIGTLRLHQPIYE